MLNPVEPIENELRETKKIFFEIMATAYDNLKRVLMSC
jgi:hypothetical protein